MYCRFVLPARSVRVSLNQDGRHRYVTGGNRGSTQWITAETKQQEEKEAPWEEAGLTGGSMVTVVGHDEN